MTDSKWARRDFLRLSAQTAGGLALSQVDGSAVRSQNKSMGAAELEACSATRRSFNGPYSGAELNYISFPMGGIGAGMICLDGTGALSHISIRNKPDLFNEPCAFAALAIKGANPIARVLEGPVPARKVFGPPGSGLGDIGASYGLPRFEGAKFESRFPFGKVLMVDSDFPFKVELTGWSPFEAGDADSSSLPVAGMEYTLTNRTSNALEAVFSFNARNFLATEECSNAVRPMSGGFALWNGAGPQGKCQEVAFSVTTPNSGVQVNHCWFRGLWWQDPLTVVWRDVERATYVTAPPVPEKSPGASLFVPLRAAPGESVTVVLQLAWYSGWSSLRYGEDPPGVEPKKDDTYRPWYAGRFNDLQQVADYWRASYSELRQRTLRFSDCFYDNTLPPEVTEAVAANLAILKSPTVLRQTDGRFWGFEGCAETDGSCPGSCTHVWNYAQAVAHLFPKLERSLRETEFGPSQDETGRQVFRSAIPIRPSVPGEADAADGQLGGIIKIYREWRISGDNAWLEALWPRVKSSLDYCIRAWDPRHVGLLEEPHHNTYDIEFWGPEPMCTGLYLGALQAAVLMCRALGEDASPYEKLMKKGVATMETEFFNGEYFHQEIRGDGISGRYIKSVKEELSPEARKLIESEGPNYQYRSGCLSDGMLGVWLASMCGVEHPFDANKVRSHLQAIHRYNLKKNLSDISNTQRPNYALGDEGGLLLCSWPRGGKPTLPVIFSDEVWTGIEYQVASHMIQCGMIEEGLEIVRTCRGRYDGRIRNPFDEYECGHWYARAMSSYALLEALSGVRYDAVERILYLKPAIRGDFRSFLSTSTGYGTVGIKEGHPFVQVISGHIPYRKLVHTEASIPLKT